ncbi:MAG: cytidylate kinase family protein [Microgenomates group bacterium]
MKFDKITVSGKAGVGTSTLSKHLAHSLKWKYINVGTIQREFDVSNGLLEYDHGSTAHTDEHERSIEQMTQDVLNKETNIVYEAWLSGFMARETPKTLRVLLICSNFGIRIDRVSNRDMLTMKEAKHFIQIRERQNITKWKKIYGEYDFWDPKYFHVIIDTAKCGPMETVGIVLDKLGYNMKHEVRASLSKND